MQPVPRLKLILIIKKRMDIDIHNCEHDLHFPFESTSTLYSQQSIADYNWEALSGNSMKKGVTISNKNVHM